MPASRRASPSSPAATESRVRPRRRVVPRLLAAAGIVLSAAYLVMVTWHAVEYTQTFPSDFADPGLLPFALQLPGLGFDAPAELTVAAVMVAVFLASLAVLVLPRPAVALAAASPPSDAASPSSPAVSPAVVSQASDQPSSHEATLPIPPLPDVPPAEAELLVDTAADPDADISTGSPFPSGEGGPGVRSRFSRIFISHSSADNDFGVRLTRYLRDELGLDVFYDSDGGPTTDRSGGLLAGDDWQTRIERELGERNTFVVILSPAALASQWVALELRTAFAQAVSIAGKVFIPVLHQPPSAVEVPLFMARYQWVSFAARDERAAYDELGQAVRLGQSRLRQDAGADLERLGPPFELGVLTPTDHFVGREQDLAWVLDHLQASVGGAGLASIAAANGFAGIGKSTLAWRAIQQVFAENRFPDGIAVVKCNDLADPVLVVRRVLSRFDPQGREPDTADLDQLGRLAAARFNGERALVVLDNVEPELPIAQVVAPLRSAGVALLLTSRQELPSAAVPPEASLMLNLLTPDQALELFAEYYGRGAAPDLTPSEQDAARRIVKALGYHTLAVKLAATLALRRKRPLDTLAREYEADPRLSDTLKDGDEAVQVLLESSYAALPESGQKLLVALAAFPTADVGRRAVLAVAEALEIADARDGLDAILDLHLAEPGLDETLTSEQADRERIRLHALVRGYAQRLFDDQEPEPRDAARAAVATWYANYANATPDADKAPDEVNIAGAIELAAALGDDRSLARLTNGMKDYWRDHSRTDARERFLLLGLNAARRIAESDGASGKDRMLVALLRMECTQLLRYLGHMDEAVAILDQADARMREDIKERPREGTDDSELGDTAIAERRRHAEAHPEHFVEQALALSREVKDRRGEAAAVSMLGDIAMRRGDLDEAAGRYEQALAIMREVKDRRGEAAAVSMLGDIAMRRGDLGSAEGRFEQSLAISREVKFREGEGTALIKLGHVAGLRRDLDRAEGSYKQGLAQVGEIGYAATLAIGSRLFGEFLISQRGKHDEGCGYLQEAIRLYMQMGLEAQAEEARETARRLGCGG